MAGLDVKVSQLGEVVVTSDNDLLNLVTYDELNQTYVSGKVKASTMKDYMIGDTDISGLGDGTPTGAIDAVNDKIEDNVISTMTQNGAHNLCEFVATTQTMGGVVFTVDNTNNIVTANNTSSGDIQFYDVGKFTPSKTGSYILSGCTGGSDSTYGFRLIDITANTSTFQYDSEVTATLTAGHAYLLRIHVFTSGVAFSNQKFYPMIRLASDTDTTYAPYAKTNRQLTDYIIKKTVTTSSISFTANTEKNGLYELTSDIPTGYIPFGIVGYNINIDASVRRLRVADYNGTWNLEYSVKTTTTISTQLIVDILFVKK